MDDDVYASRIDLLEFLSGLLGGPPDGDFVRGLTADEALGPAPSVNDPIDKGFELLASFHDDHADANPADVEEAVLSEYARLFEDGRVATRERDYRGPDEDVTRRLVAVYDDADWSPPEGDLDAIGTEIAFLYHLVERQRAGVGTALDREGQFLEDHLSRWVDPFVHDLADAADSDLYRGTAALLRGVVDLETALVTSQLLD